MKAKPVLGGISRSTAEMESRPPAEAPMPTTIGSVLETGIKADFSTAAALFVVPIRKS